MPLISRRVFGYTALLFSVQPTTVLATSHALETLRAPANIVAVRVWPAPEYTRLTLESDRQLQTQHVFVPHPPHLVLDIFGVELNPELRALVAKITSNDPFIAGVRVGQFAPGVVRLLVDLKQSTQPQVFLLPPVAVYQHRLVIDLYPSTPIDPLEALLTSIQSNKTLTIPANPPPSPTAATSGPSGASSRLGIDQLEAWLAEKMKKIHPPAQTAPPVAPSMPSTPSSLTPPAPQSPSVTALSQKSLPKSPQATSSAPQIPSQQKAGATNLAPTTQRLIIIAIDPGHGGEDPGAIGPSGTREKDVVLQMGQLLKRKINHQTIAGYPVRAFLTRDGDYFVPLHSRVKKAQQVKADLFISIHADAFFTPTARGASVFALSEKGASSAAARWIANKENNADTVGGINLKVKDEMVKLALLDMSTTAQIKDSLHLGNIMVNELGRVAKMHKIQVEQASFAVLKAPDIPSILIETAFISHPEEEQKLKNPVYQDQLTDTIVQGLQRYFAKNPPLIRNRQI